MNVYRSLIRYKTMESGFRLFQCKCEKQYSKFGKKSSLSRCRLLNSKKECNQQNCPLYESSTNKENS